jgi:hypothetical protein
MRKQNRKVYDDKSLETTSSKYTIGLMARFLLWFQEKSKRKRCKTVLKPKQVENRKTKKALK